MTGLHESTLALSVYNAVARMGSMNSTQLVTFLSKEWDGRVEVSEVEEGIDYLSRRKMVTIAGGNISPARLDRGAARTVLRNPARLTELVFGAIGALPTPGMRLG